MSVPGRKANTSKLLKTDGPLSVPGRKASDGAVSGRKSNSSLQLGSPDVLQKEPLFGGETDQRQPIYSESESESKLFCQPCLNDRCHIEASGYCNNCQEYLCSKCFQFHKETKVLQHHFLLDSSQMPRNQSPLDHFFSKTCDKHFENTVEYYCSTHETIGCAVCVNNSHKNCKGVTRINEISMELTHDNLEHQYLHKDMKNLISEFIKQKNISNSNEEQIEEYHIRAISDIEAFRNEINAVLDKLEQTVVGEAKLLRDEDMKYASSVSASIDSALTDLDTISSGLEQKQESKQYDELFIAMKKVEHRINMYKGILNGTQTNNKIRKYEFKQDKKTTEVMSTLETFGELIKQREDLKADYVGEINAKSPTNQKEAWITGMTNLADGQLAVADNSNVSVKLLDVKENRITSELLLSSQPWDITEVTKGQLAVTLPNARKIALLSLSRDPILKQTTEIQTNGKCHGIASCKDKMVVSFTEPGKVQIINTSGKILKDLTRNSSGTTLFKEPSYVTINPDMLVMYISDCTQQAVTSLTLDGVIKHTYKDKSLNNPTGVITTPNRGVFICGYRSGDIHEITPRCSQVQILLGKEDGIYRPQTIQNCHRDDTLYISSGKLGYRNAIKVFKLHTTSTYL